MEIADRIHSARQGRRRIPCAIREAGGPPSDLLKARHPAISVADPVIRFNQLITLPMVDLVERRRGAQVWQSSRPTYHSKILGPHVEETAREWARSFALDETGLSLGAVGTAEIADPAARTRHEVDLLAIAPGERPQNPRAAIALIGEAKATVQPRGLKDLERLEHIRTLLADQGHRPHDATLALFSLHGFHPDVIDAARHRRDVLLVDIGALYGDGPIHGLT